MEQLDLMNVIEVKNIVSRCNDNEREIIKYIINIANIRINNKGLDMPCPFEIEINIAPTLSDHSSDSDGEFQDLVFIEDSDSD